MRLLLVEDEPGIANFLKQGLEEENFAVDVAMAGREGLHLALSGVYDLIILDWMLPELTGIEICTQLRKVDSQTPVIFLTAKDTVDETVFGLKVGANDYVRKPFHFEELLQRIEVQLRAKRSDKTMKLGPIELDPAAHLVRKNGAEIQLTQKEFALLEMLISNKGRVCTRTRIIESVWDIHFDYNTGVIDVFINSLRKKLELTDDEQYIQTVRGVGYMAREL